MANIMVEQQNQETHCVGWKNGESKQRKVEKRENRRWGWEHRKKRFKIKNK